MPLAQQQGAQVWDRDIRRKQLGLVSYNAKAAAPTASPSHSRPTFNLSTSIYISADAMMKNVLLLALLCLGACSASISDRSLLSLRRRRLATTATAVTTFAEMEAQLKVVQVRQGVRVWRCRAAGLCLVLVVVWLEA